MFLPLIRLLGPSGGSILMTSFNIDHFTKAPKARTSVYKFETHSVYNKLDFSQGYQNIKLLIIVK